MYFKEFNAELIKLWSDIDKCSPHHLAKIGRDINMPENILSQATKNRCLIFDTVYRHYLNNYIISGVVGDLGIISQIYYIFVYHLYSIAEEPHIADQVAKIIGQRETIDGFVEYEVLWLGFDETKYY